MNTKENLRKEAERFGFYLFDAFDGDVDLRPNYEVGTGKTITSAADLIQLAASLQEQEYSLTFMKDNSVHVHAPHRKEHSWGDRGWDCTHGLTVEGCEKFRVIEKYKDKTKEELLAARAQAVQMRDMCLGGLYQGVNQGIVDEIDTVLRGRGSDRSRDGGLSG